jgi:pyridinium-3,5-bisthiocarboxylic acid mononucleotide nickel chelatase
MNRIAYLDCFSGASGNMLLGAFLDCGLDRDGFRAQLDLLGVTGYELNIREKQSAGLRGAYVEVSCVGEMPVRHLADIEAMIQPSRLPARVKEISLRVFRRLAEAEARVHGEPVERVHFHEVGAVDAIVDIVGCAICLEMLQIEKVFSSPLPQGHGTIHTSHGILPIPAPATAELLRGIPVYGRDVEAELVTPTGAALVATLAESFGSLPAMMVEHVGYGAGSRDLPWANVLRVMVGKADNLRLETDRVVEVQANIDDMNPEWFEHLVERLLEVGALDAFLTPIQMKRGRPAMQVGVLVAESSLEQALGVLFAETTTIGVRMHTVERRKLDRESVIVPTEFGPIAVKVARWEGRLVNLAPEYKDCLRVAKEQKIPLKEIYQATISSARASIRK